MDFGKAVTALTQLGFESIKRNAARVVGASSTPYEAISFLTPHYIYRSFLVAFDEGLLPELILND